MTEKLLDKINYPAELRKLKKKSIRADFKWIEVWSN